MEEKELNEMLEEAKELASKNYFEEAEEMYNQILLSYPECIEAKNELKKIYRKAQKVYSKDNIVVSVLIGIGILFFVYLKYQDSQNSDSQKEVNELNYYNGIIEKNYFTNRKLGWEVEIPEGWELLNSGHRNTIFKQMIKSANGDVELISAFKEIYYGLEGVLGLVKIKETINREIAGNVFSYLEPPSDSIIEGIVLTEGVLADRQYDYLNEQNDVDSIEHKEMRIDNINFKGVCFKTLINDINFTREIYFKRIKHRNWIIEIQYSDSKTKNEIYSVLKQSSIAKL